MLRELESCQVAIGDRLIDAMRSLERSGVEIALVMEGGRLIGVMTDGDIRRALLKGSAIDSPLAPHVQRDFTSVHAGVGRVEVLDLMQARTLEQIPVVDAEGNLIGLHLLHEVVGRSERPNWAVIMAGGKGTRLRPITEHLPKPMIPVAGRPILERLVLHLVGHGIRRIFLAINYLGHIVEKHFGDGRKFGCEIEYLRESQPLGTGGALSLLPSRPNEPLLVLNGDLVTQVNVDEMLEFHRNGGHLATIGLRQYAHMVPFGCVRLNGSRIIHFEEKPMLSRLINTGIYVLSPALLERIHPAAEFPITHLFEECLRRGESVGGFEATGDWIDVGQRDQLREAREGSA